LALTFTGSDYKKQQQQIKPNDLQNKSTGYMHVQT